ncbi:FtsW/RodA/SpoVE family cell cycle protein, partial [Enterococcus faecium]|uniref:FtsW/RodA/SpoVE family cell cycle protein n=1 Tax=Enterococcus faecium TaxID=1352 RepID=UPI000957AEBE
CFENIGASIGLLPLTGIPLPYISQGGSAILSNFWGWDLCCVVVDILTKKKEHKNEFKITLYE